MLSPMVWLAVCSFFVTTVLGQHCFAGDREPEEHSLSSENEASTVSLIARKLRAKPIRDSATTDLKDFAFRLATDASPADFSFQWEGRGPRVDDEAKTTASRRVYDCLPSGSMELLFMGCGLPTRVAVDGDIYCFNYVLPWQHVINAKWAFMPSEGPFHTWDRVRPDATQPGGFVRVDLGAFLRGVVTPEDDSLIWDPDCRCLRLDRSNGVTYTLRIRTPNDAERYGTSLSQLRNVSDDGVSSFAWSHFVVSRPSVLRFQKPTKAAVEKAIGEWKTVDSSDRPLLPTGSRSGEPVRPLWDTLVTFSGCDGDEARRMKSEQTIESLCKFIGVFRSTQHAENTPMLCDAMAQGLIKELRAAEKCVRKGLARETNGMGMDDPLLSWRAAELQLTSRVAAILYGAGLTLLNDCPASAEAKYLFCDALADMGTPCVDFIGGNTIGNALSKDSVVRGILHSHWQWECSAAEVEACAALVRSEPQGSRIESVAIEALVRMNRLDRVPGDRLARWFAAEAGNADESTRTETLRILSQVPRGQQYLLERFGPEHPPSPIRDAVWKMLLYRAEATIRTKRFDFLSEDDCRKILAFKEASAQAP